MDGVDWKSYEAEHERANSLYKELKRVEQALNAAEAKCYDARRKELK